MGILNKQSFLLLINLFEPLLSQTAVETQKNRQSRKIVIYLALK